MTKLKFILFTLGCLAFFCVNAFAVEKALTAEIHDKTGKIVGHLRVSQVGNGVTFYVAVKGFTPGLHGIHIHSVGKCEGPDFKSSGAHFALAGQGHGMDNPKGPHIGDMPNLSVKANGTGHLKFHTDLLTLHDGDNSLRKVGGTSLIVHEKQDDQKSDPSGNSGARIACAVIFP